MCVQVCVSSSIPAASSNSKFLWLLFQVLLKMHIILFFPFNVLWHRSNLSLVLHILHKLFWAFMGQVVRGQVFACLSWAIGTICQLSSVFHIFWVVLSDIHFPLDLAQSKISHTYHVFVYSCGFQKSLLKVL